MIVAVNGVKIKSSSALQEQISKYRPGDKVELTINRNGSTKKFTVELRNAQGSTKVVKGGDSAEVMGAAFKALNDEQKRKLGVSYGIEVTGLTSGKLKDAGIKKGFIIMIVNKPEDLCSGRLGKDWWKAYFKDVRKIKASSLKASTRTDVRSTMR